MNTIVDFFASQSSPITQALYAGLFTWILTAVGAGLVFFLKTTNRKFLDAALGFTGGVMIAASFWSLLSPAISAVEIQNKLGLPINKQPKFFPPKDPHLPARFVIASNKIGNKLNFGNECLKYLWSLEKDISDYKSLQEICENLSLNFNELKEIALTNEVRLEYEKNSNDAIDKDVFGAPSYVLNNEIFWGQDRLEYLEDALKKQSK